MSTPARSSFAILGTGLIGGSLGLALRERGLGQVAGWDPDPAALDGASEVGAIDRASSSLTEAVEGADVVFACGPVDSLPDLLRQVAATGSHAVVSDVGSVKVPIVEAGAAALGDRFIGGHPMAGSERHGPRAADAALFQDASWILTPTGGSDPATYSTLAAVVSALGARPVALAPDRHDRVMAMLSHVPQVVASAVVSAVTAATDEALLPLAAGGFRDVTRIAASDADVWLPILMANREAVVDGLQGLVAQVQDAADAIASGRWDDVHGFLARASAARRESFARPDLSGNPVTVWMPVIDRPGVLAEVTTTAAQTGVNIEDLRIVHSIEGGRGRLELVVTGEGAGERLRDGLRPLGYSVHLAAPGDLG